VVSHFIALADFTSTQIISYLDRARYFSQLPSDELKKVLPHVVIANVFFEPSTRTRISFEMAAKRLGAEVINFDLTNSSVQKGETLLDTLKTLEAIGCDAIVLRHSDDRIFELLKNNFRIPLINAGAGKNEHPSQGLLDLYTLREEFGKLEGLHLGILGDVKHSRVAGSMMLVAKKLGLHVSVFGPEEFIPTQLPENCRKAEYEKTLPSLDAIMCLRNQFERHELIDFNRVSFFQRWGLTLEREKLLAPHCIIMHPAPINRGVEIDEQLIEAPRSRIFKQMTNGVFVRMCILESKLRMKL
jgi:aspartate carbamoyltransferase catalytic subunit